MFLNSCRFEKLVSVCILLSVFVSCGGGGGGNNDSGPSPGGNEGTISGPAGLNSGEPHAGSIGTYGTSYYTFTTGAGGSYAISLTGTQSDLSWDLYADKNFSFFIGDCDSLLVPGDEICTMDLAASTQYYLLVDNWDVFPGTFTVTVASLVPSAGCGSGAAKCFDFETGTVPPLFTMSGNAAWTIDTIAGSGTYSLRSGNITDNQTTCFAYTPANTTKTVGFSLQADTEAIWDKFKLYIDASLYAQTWSGNTPWKRVVFSVVPGVHTYKWCYEKDNLSAAGLDAVWIDDIEFN